MPPEVFNPTFDQLHIGRIKARCNKPGPLAYVQEVCAELKATNYYNAPTNLSYTTHYWIHKYLSSYPKIRHFVNITTVLQTLGESFNVNRAVADRPSVLATFLGISSVLSGRVARKYTRVARVLYDQDCRLFDVKDVI